MICDWVSRKSCNLFVGVVRTDFSHGFFAQILHGFFAQILRGFFAQILHGFFAQILRGFFAQILHGFFAQILRGFFPADFRGPTANLAERVRLRILLDFYPKLCRRQINTSVSSVFPKNCGIQSKNPCHPLIRVIRVIRVPQNPRHPNYNFIPD
jgi:hypothetical protein